MIRPITTDTSIGPIKIQSISDSDLREYFKSPAEQSPNGLVKYLIKKFGSGRGESPINPSRLTPKDIQAISKELLNCNNNLSREHSRRPSESYSEYLYKVMKNRYGTKVSDPYNRSSFKTPKKERKGLFGSVGKGVRGIFSDSTTAQMAASLFATKALADKVVVNAEAQSKPVEIAKMPANEPSIESRKLDSLQETNRGIANAIDKMNEFQVSASKEMKITEDRNYGLNIWSIKIAVASIVLSIIFSTATIIVTIRESNSSTDSIVDSITNTKKSLDTHLDSLISIHKKLLANSQTLNSKENGDSSAQNQDEFIKQTDIIIKRLEHMSQHLHSIDKKSH